MAPKIALIGLDCAAPHLVFETFREEMPNLTKLAERGSFGPLQTVVPPITVPAWMCMMTGKDPGELGIYGFRNRKDYSYRGVRFAHGGLRKEPALWDYMASRGKQSLLVGIPMTYPPRPVMGNLVTGFLTPGRDVPFTWPESLRSEVLEISPSYPFDAENFRTHEKQRLLEEIHLLTREQFRVAKELSLRKEWDFFALVQIGPDRMHHAFWAYHDTSHPKHDPQSPFVQVLREYYRQLDLYLGELFATFPKDTRILVVSDHGVQKMHGGIALNDWLIQEGYLVLKEMPSRPTKIEKLIEENCVDWKNTLAWAWGGYSGKIHLNVRGREPQGIVPPRKVAFVRDRLVEKLKALPGEDGLPLQTQIYIPQEMYRKVRNVAPDLFVHFDNLAWRSLGSVGNNSLWVHENDTGPDDANHAMEGIFISSEKTRVTSILDIHEYVRSLVE